MPMFFVGNLLFSYNKRYQKYIAFVNSFLNNIMLKNQQGGNFNSPVFLNNPKETHNNDTISMLKDLKKNNIINVEDEQGSDRKIIYFTRDFQQVLERM
jgi:hypothetical protein